MLPPITKRVRIQDAALYHEKFRVSSCRCDKIPRHTCLDDRWILDTSYRTDECLVDASQIPYQNFVIKDLKEGSWVIFKDTHRLEGVELKSKEASGLLHKSGEREVNDEADPFREDDESLTLRQRIWNAFEDPLYSPLSMMIACFIFLLIIFSTCTFIAETAPSLYDPDAASNYRSTFFIMEAVCIAFFTIEVSLRMVSCPN